MDVKLLATIAQVLFDWRVILAIVLFSLLIILLYTLALARSTSKMRSLISSANAASITPSSPVRTATTSKPVFQTKKFKDDDFPGRKKEEDLSDDIMVE